MAHLSSRGPQACRRLFLSECSKGNLRPSCVATPPSLTRVALNRKPSESSKGEAHCRAAGLLQLPAGVRAFGSRSRRQVEAFWEAEHLAHDLQNEARRVDDAEEQHATLTGREVQSLWESEEIQDEFHRSIGRRRASSGARRSRADAATKAATSAPAGPPSQVEADWSDWLRRYEPAEEAFSPPPPPSRGGRGRRRRTHTATGLENEPHEKQRAEEASLDFDEGAEDAVDALFDYASLRGGDYRDLTHEEAIRMRDAYQQKLLLDRRIRWLKSRALPDPDKDAAAIIRAQEPQTEDALVKSLGLDDGVRAARRLVRMEADAERQELASRIRAKMREEKLANAKLMKAALPNVQGQVVDPIKFHVARRTIRQARLLQSQLEEILTWNSAEVLHGLLGGASVSIHHVEQQTTSHVYDGLACSPTIPSRFGPCRSVWWVSPTIGICCLVFAVGVALACTRCDREYRIERGPYVW
ncbi:hypothetical protein Emed_000316 [Eimeria media]